MYLGAGDKADGVGFGLEGVRIVDDDEEEGAGLTVCGEIEPVDGDPP